MAFMFPSPSATVNHTTSSFLLGSTGRCYHVSCGRHFGRHLPRYLESQLDFFAVHIKPEDSWYILPASIVCPHRYLYLLRTSKNDGTPTQLMPYRGRAAHQFEPYREAWHLMREK